MKQCGRDLVLPGSLLSVWHKCIQIPFVSSFPLGGVGACLMSILTALGAGRLPGFNPIDSRECGI